MAMGLAVLLHESLHATGPTAAEDVAGTRSGRAFEEGVTEAATLDLLGPLAAGLDLPAPLRRRLVAAAGRYRAAYPAEVAWVRRLSARATGSARGSPRARAWRVRAADTWGAGRWARLAAATGIGEDALRASAPGGRRQVTASPQTTTISTPASRLSMPKPATGSSRSTSWGV